MCIMFPTYLYNGLFIVSTCSYSFKLSHLFELLDPMCFKKSFTDVGQRSIQDTSDCWCGSFQRDELRDFKKKHTQLASTGERIRDADGETPRFHCRVVHWKFQRGWISELNGFKETLWHWGLKMCFRIVQCLILLNIVYMVYECAY